MNRWQFAHRLFGMHFVAVRYGYSDMVRRLRWTPTRRPYVTICDEFIWLDTTERRWEALTFDKDAFLAERVDAAGHPLPKLRSAA